jgi:hypothetical protein
MREPDIDLVCCWVSLNDEYYEKLNAYSQFANEKNALNKGRFREFGELKFSIVAALKNLPWLRKIYIVTNGQSIPEDINNLSKVEVVHHEDFYRNQEDLPTFSYHSIEANLCFINGLSEHFIITNDDFFITGPMEKSEFLGTNNTGVFIHTRTKLNDIEEPANVWQANLKSTDDVLTSKYGSVNRKLFPHIPQLAMKSKCIEMWDVFESELKAVSANKFRENNNIIFRALYSYYVAYQQWGVKGYDELITASEGDVRYFKKNEFLHISLKPPGKGNWQNKLESIIESPPLFFCLNDDIPHHAYEESAKIVVCFLKKIFNSKS